MYLSVNHPDCGEAKPGSGQHVLPVVVVVRCATQRDDQRGKEEEEGEQQSPGRVWPHAVESAQLTGKIQEDETPGSKGER